MILPLLLASALASATPPPITPLDLVTVADLSGLAESPDRAWVVVRVERASVSSAAVETEWWAIATRDGAQRQLGSGGVALVNGAGVVEAETPVWSRDSRAFYARVAGAGGVQVWRFALDGTPPRAITDDAGDVADFALDANGGALTYHADAPRAARSATIAAMRASGVRVDAHVDLMAGAAGGRDYLGREVPLVSTGVWFGREELPAAVGAARRIVLDDGAPSFRPIKASSPVATDTIGRVPACVGGRCVQANWVAAVRQGGALIATRETADGAQSLWRIDRGRSVRLLSYSGQIGGGGPDTTPCALDRRFAYCVTSAADQPPVLVRFDLAKSGTTTLLDPNAALRARTRGRVTEMPVGHGALTTSAFFVAPRAPAPATGSPLVISYYRCDGFLRGGVGDELPIWPLADHGVAVLCIDAVARDRTGKTKRDELEAAQTIVEAAVAQLSRRGLVDRTRVGMHGLSFGSEVTMWVAGHGSDLAAAAVASGQLEPSLYWSYAVPGRDAPEVLQRFWGLGDPERDPAGWSMLAPASWATSIKAPLLLQLPEAEARWSIELWSKLSRSGTPAELWVFPLAAHIKSDPRQKLAAYTRNLDWFRFWLTDTIDPSPAKAPQFARWVELRRQRAAPQAQRVAAP